MKDIILNHQTAILKDIFKEAEKSIKQKERSDVLVIELAKNSNSIESQRHWQALSHGDIKIKEVNTLLEELYIIDLITNWHDRVLYNQDKLKFVNKYEKTLKAYEFKYKQLIT